MVFSVSFILSLLCHFAICVSDYLAACCDFDLYTGSLLEQINESRKQKRMEETRLEQVCNSIVRLKKVNHDHT